jgi:hypothetical protein
MIWLSKLGFGGGAALQKSKKEPGQMILNFDGEIA